MRNLRFSQQIVSRAWSGVNRIARFARDHEWIESKKLPVRTIGIGNLQAGGTGKTPLAIRIARDAAQRGLLVGILTRGYHSAWERSGGILSPGEPSPSPVVCGDEPALIHDQAPAAWIGVGADRLAQFEKMQSQVIQKMGKPFDLILLDDAFQHWKIRCDQYVLAVTDAEFGERIFRDGFNAVRAEDLVVLTKGHDFPAALAHHSRRVKARFHVRPAPPGRRYRFVAALGDPERARMSFIDAGYSIASMSVFPDHHAFTSLEVKTILDQAASREESVLLSGKDWVKWRALGVAESLVVVVEPEIEIHEGGEYWSSLLTGKERE